MSGVLHTQLGRAFGASQTSVSWALNSDNNNGTVTFSFRQDCTLAAYGTQIRVTFNCSNSANWTAQHVSVGTTGTAPSMSTTPKEILFSGSSGFSMTSGQTIVSDWTDFVTRPGSNIIIDVDCTVSNNRILGTATGAHWYYKSGATDWNTASVAGYTDGGAISNGISLIEVRQ